MVNYKKEIEKVDRGIGKMKEKIEKMHKHREYLVELGKGEPKKAVGKKEE